MNTGWICPNEECKRVYGPQVEECRYCNGERFTLPVTVPPQPSVTITSPKSGFSTTSDLKANGTTCVSFPIFDLNKGEQ